MQNGGGRANGKTNSDTEVEEYFMDSINTDEVEELEPVASENNDHKDQVEIRRLTALVTHLREQVGEMKSRPQSDDNARHRGSAFPSAAFAALAVVGLVGAGWALQARSFYRY